MIEQIINWFSEIESKYNVNPFIFSSIYLISIAPCWISLFKIIKYIRNKNTHKTINWTIIFALVFLSPYIYVYLFGRNYPLWFHFVLIIIVILSIFSVLNKIMTNIKNKKT